jgi:Domain of unknown function (DUF1707)
MSAASPSPLPWGRFTVDPRRPEAAGLRASDRDRDVVLEVLTEGYADGRLTREEYDERATATSSAKTLGDLPAMIRDLVPDRPVARVTRSDAEDLHRQAVERWAAQRRQAFTAFLLPTVICWAIWLMAGLGDHAAGSHIGFPWPAFVTLGTGAGLARVLGNKRQLIAQHERRLAKRQRRELERDARRAEHGRTTRDH